MHAAVAVSRNVFTSTCERHSFVHALMRQAVCCSGASVLMTRCSCFSAAAATASCVTDVAAAVTTYCYRMYVYTQAAEEERLGMPVAPHMQGLTDPLRQVLLLLLLLLLPIIVSSICMYSLLLIVLLVL
jgi:hypothetical protein